MFGTWRLLLAVEVVFHHLVHFPEIGIFAVFSFFSLSGFLMTAILQKTYGYSAAGFASYIGNRFLRLYPGYWLAVAVSLVLIALLGAEFMSAYRSAIRIPGDAGKWVQNLSLIFWSLTPNRVEPRLSPPTWALTVEILYYVAIGIGFSRNRMLATGWLLASIAYVLAMLIVPQADGLYGSLASGSLPFAAGACTYHYRTAIAGILTGSRFGSVPLILTARYGIVLVAILLVHLADLPLARHLFNILNIALSCAVIVLLFDLKAPAWRALDKRLGDFSYPVYLLHWQCGALASFLLFGRPVNDWSLQSLAVCLLALPLTAAVASVCVFGIDPAVEKLRSAVRSRASGRRLGAGALTRAVDTA